MATEIIVERFAIIELSMIPDPVALEVYLETLLVGENAWDVEYSEIESNKTWAVKPMRRHHTTSPWEIYLI